MIWVPGDCHGDFRRFSTRNFPQQKQMTREDFVVICGDFGLWHDTREERFWLDWLNGKPFTTLFVDGNHEHHDRLDRLPIKEWNGGLVHRIRPNILHLCRGQVFDLNGTKCFAFGGGETHDAKGILSREKNTARRRRQLKRRDTPFRVEGEDWWYQELPRVTEVRQGLDNLAWEDWSVDYVFTHCLPTDLQQRLFPNYPVNVLTDFLRIIRDRTAHEGWFCGHYHQDVCLKDEKIHVLYEQIIPIEGEADHE